MEQRGMRLSIVVNMYNTAPYLPKCMDTLLHQNISGDEYEIILVDDGSTDESLLLAKKYVLQGENNPSWPLIRICAHANKGLAGARNTGVDAAIGEYLCFVDPDDYIEKNSLSALIRQMADEQLDMLRFNYQKVDEEGNLVADSKMEANFDYSSRVMTGKEFMAQRLTTTCYVWAYIYRLEIIKKNNIRFIEGGYFDDTPWLPRVLQKVKRINCTPIRHQYYLQRGGSLVHTVNKENVLRKVYGQLNLIDVLLDQLNQSTSDIHRWYKTMISHICVSLLTSVAVYDYNNIDSYLNKVKPFFSLMSTGSFNDIYKIRLLNVCPKLFLWLIHVKSML